ncbi:uncharacterized protein LOC129568381 isoform X2 [Sitodiplosis mosellana]|nr:uncharacterized protein LOC129568381 isoform X2 [Sitodiplosis mosellana]
MDSPETTDSVQNAKKRRIEDPNAKEKDASTNDASFGFLNSKLLKHIFAMVNLKDLAALGSACKKFKKNAREVFAEKHGSELFEVHATESLVKIAEILRCFQNQFTKLGLFYSNKSKANVKIDVLVNKYCHQSLSEIQFTDVGLYSSARSFTFPFCSVTSLVVHSGLLSGKLDDIVTLFPNVMNLDLHRGVQPGGAKDNSAIPTLRHLSFSFDPDHDLDSYTNLLVKTNPQLISLKVHYSDETPTEHLWLIRDSLPNLLRLSLDVKIVRVDKEPFRPLLFNHLRYLSINCAINSHALKLLVITSKCQIKRLDISIEGNVDANCISFLKRHQSDELRLTVSKMNNQHIEQLKKMLQTATKVEFIIRNDFMVSRNGLMDLISKCEKLKSIRIEQTNVTGLPPIEISMQGIGENIWNKD